MPGPPVGGFFDKWKLPVASSSRPSSPSLSAPPLRQRRAATSSSHRGLSYRSSGKIRSKEGKDVEILTIVDSDDDDHYGDIMVEADDDDSLDLATMLRDSGKSREMIRHPQAPSNNGSSNGTRARPHGSSLKSLNSPYKHSSTSTTKRIIQLSHIPPSEIGKLRSGLKPSDPIEISSTSSRSSGSSVLPLSELIAPPVRALSGSINESAATSKSSHLQVPTKPVVVKALYESSPKKPKKPKVVKSGEQYDESYRPPSRETHRTDSTSVIGRPLRVPLEPGKYTLPPIDTPIHDWPQDRAPLGAVKVETKGSTRAVSRQITPRNQSPQTPRIDHPLPSTHALKEAQDEELDHLLRSSQSDKKEAQGEELDRPPRSSQGDKKEALDEELDLLDEFADFDFTAPDRPSPSAHEGTPRTPKAAIKHNPSQSANIATPSRSVARISSAYLSPTHASTAKKSPRKLSHHRSSSRLAESQSSQRSHSPKPHASTELSTETEDANRIATILANAEAGRKAEEQREKEEQEDRKRRIDALLALPEQEDDEDAELSFGTILE
ncbi:hypothetical protein BCR39DRAFT_75717 [Naematelia encephala]|uniref:Uncharacterized protein n=1 Tax=Naematelia encephala TaxID=71784 RepID=A0A1Y2AFZ3_9TREE|nr:hypothetical protein BCR39DRAFT_75717 [Naematelia encephala]